MRSSRQAGGFTLLEIAVALAIAGIGMVACMQIFGGSLRLEDRASRQTRAVLHARSEMSKLVFDPPKTRSTETTSPDGLRTRITVRAAQPPEIPTPSNETEVEEDDLPRYVEVEVGWQDGLGTKTYRLKTLALRMDPENLGKEGED